MLISDLKMGLTNTFCKGLNSIFSFADQMFSTNTQLYQCSTKAAVDSKPASGCGSVPNIFFTKQAAIEMLPNPDLKYGKLLQSSSINLD